MDLENQSPDFVDGSEERSVDENVARRRRRWRGVLHGQTVRSVSSKDRLTYGLRAFTILLKPTTAIREYSNAPGSPADDLAAFRDKPGDGADHRGAKPGLREQSPHLQSDPHDGKYVVVATVFDPSGLMDDYRGGDHHGRATVNDNPVLGVGQTGRPELTIQENRDGNTSEDTESPAFDSLEVFDGNMAGQNPVS